MTSCLLQSNYSSTVTLHGGPVVLHPVTATPCSRSVAYAWLNSGDAKGTGDPNRASVPSKKIFWHYVQNIIISDLKSSTFAAFSVGFHNKRLTPYTKSEKKDFFLFSKKVAMAYWHSPGYASNATVQDYNDHFSKIFSRLKNYIAAVSYLLFRILLCFSILFVFGFCYITVGYTSCWALVSSCNCELWSISSTFKLDLDRVKVTTPACQISFNSNVTVQTHRWTHTRTHTTTTTTTTTP